MRPSAGFSAEGKKLMAALGEVDGEELEEKEEIAQLVRDPMHKLGARLTVLFSRRKQLASGLEGDRLFRVSQPQIRSVQT